MTEERVQRRLAAILAVDVVGYSRLMEADEAGTRTRLRSLHSELIDPRITTDGGRIVKTTGDGILAEFPSAVDAVRSALGLQREIAGIEPDRPADQRLIMRMGINLGDVIIEEGDVFGDGVNVAARLEGLCEPGQVYVSGTIHDQVDGKLSADFDDLGEHTVKNIARPVRVYRARDEKAETVQTVPDNPTPALGEKPSIAVLPFENMSGDPEQEYFADGLAEDIITNLSKIPDLMVIARNSTFTYKGQAIDIKRVGREQGVTCVLEGSVRKAGERVRVTAQLIDARRGDHLWAERYDRNLTDIFDIQDEITREIVIALHVRLTLGDQAEDWRRATENVAAWEQFLRGTNIFQRHVKDENLRARVCFESAAAMDPAYTTAVVMQGWTHWNDARFGWSDDPEASFAKAMELSERATAMDDRLPDALSLLSFLKLFAHEHEIALELGERSVALNINHATSTALYGATLSFCDQPVEALETTRKAIRLSPIYPPWYLNSIGRSHTLLGQNDEAIAEFRRAIAMEKESAAPYFYIVRPLREAGRLDEARQAVTDGLRFSPRTTLSNWHRALPYRDPENLRAELAALREAGLPE